MISLQLKLMLAAAAVPLASASSHFIMGGLSPIAYERIDPIVNSGEVTRLYSSSVLQAKNIAPG